ncbi:MAG: hypothetical protein A3I16_07875 [Burkholderiales bacterium RIFCSPLOWO2_02_FULL_66_35]|jgi:uncharacterized protein (DUF1499 family)|nr:MAG: hypothetical protein A3I16_07875 [Burkholderiales bacterium RIFCSPLOWO2_02_FULL_66_35]
MNMPISRRRPILSLAGLLLSLAAIAAVLLAGIGYRQGWWHFLQGLQIAEWAVYAAGLGLVLSLAAAISARPGRQPGRRGFVSALLGVLLALPVLGMALQWEVATRTTPPINDISTDTEDPPVFWDMPNPTEYPGEKFATLQRAGYPDIAPLLVKQTPDAVYAQALALVNERGWAVVASDVAEGRIEAVATSRLFGFADEVAVRISPAEGGARVDMRSRSRLGKIDRGTNAQRIRAYLGDLNQHLGQP